MEFGDKISDTRLLSYPKGKIPPCKVMIRIASGSSDSYLAIKELRLCVSKQPDLFCFSYEELSLDGYIKLYNSDMSMSYSFDQWDKFQIVTNMKSATFTIKYSDKLYLCVGKEGLATSNSPVEWIFSHHSTNDKQSRDHMCS
jgi:hypothetical protein